MKRIALILIILTFMLSSFIFADVSIVNQTLKSTSAFNTTSENLTCNYNLNGSATTSAIAQYKNQIPVFTAYYPMEGNSTNALLDLSGNGKTATVSGATWYSNQGYNGQGVFNFSANAQYVLIPTLNLYSNNVTITAWIKGHQNADYAGIVFSRDGNTVAGLISVGDELRFTWNDYGYTVSTGLTIPDGVWTFVGLVVTPKNVTLFLNDSVAFVSYSVAIEQFDGNTYIGYDDNQVTRSWRGYIDSVRIYNYSLSIDEMNALYQNKTNTIINSKLSVGDVWKCIVTPFNATQMGSTYQSNNITILVNPIPSIENLTLKSTSAFNTTSENLTCNYDLSNSSTTSVTNWYKNNKSLTVLNLPFEGNSTNALNDYSGYSNNAVCTDCPTWSSGSYSFDGTSNFLNLKSPATLDLVGNKNFSIETYLKITKSPATTYQRIFYRNVSSTNGFQLSYGTTGNSNLLGFIVLDGSTTNYEYATNINISTNTYYHVVLTYQSQGKLNIYINGVNRTTAKTLTLSFVGGNNNFTIGKRPDNLGATFFGGNIDYIRIYNYTLEPDDILELYNNLTNIITSDDLFAGDVWDCGVTSFTNTMTGITQTSNNITILSFVNPSIAFNSSTDTSGTYKNSSLIINVTFIGTGSNATIQIYNSINSLVTQNWSGVSPFYWAYLPNSSQIYYINATAFTFNGLSATTPKNNVTFDNISPSISYVLKDSGYILRTYTIYNVTASDVNFQNITSYVYNSTGNLINTTISTINSNNKTVTNLNQGFYFINSTACDKAGNCNSTDTFNFTVDTINPTVTLNYPVNFYHYNDYTGYVNFTTSETATCSINDTRYVNITSIIGTNFSFYNSTIPSLNDTRVQIKITCIDLATNVGLNNFNFVIDTNIPFINYLNPTLIPTYTNNVSLFNVTFYVLDSYLDIINFTFWNSSNEIYSNNQTNYSSINNITLTYFINITEGNNTVEVCARDSFQNSPKIQNKTILLEITDNAVIDAIKTKQKAKNDYDYTSQDVLLIQKASSQIIRSVTYYNKNKDKKIKNNTIINITNLWDIGGEHIKTNWSTKKDKIDNYFVISFQCIGGCNNTKILTDRNKTRIIDDGGQFYFTFDDLINNGFILTFYQINDTSYVEAHLDDVLFDNKTLIYTIDPITGGLNTNCQNKTIVLDTIIPTIDYNLNSYSDDSILDVDYVFVNVTVNDLNYDNTTIYLYTSAGTLINSYFTTNKTQSVNFTALSSEIYYFNATTYDYANNKNSTLKRTVTLDNNVPSYSNIEKNETNIYFNTSVKLSIDWADYQLKNYSFYTNQSGIWVQINGTLGGNSNTTSAILNITQNSGTIIGWYFSATDLFGHTNTTPIQSFTVLSRTTSIAFTTDKNIYPQGYGLITNPYQPTINFSVSYNDTIINQPIEDGVCSVINDETSDTVSLNYDGVSKIYKGTLLTSNLYSNITFNVTCSKTNYDTKISNKTISVWWYMYIRGTENKIFDGGTYNSTVIMMRENLDGVITDTLIRNRTMNVTVGTNFIRDFMYCGLGLNCSLDRQYNIFGDFILSLNVTFNDSVCRPMLCYFFKDNFLNKYYEDCKEDYFVVANTNTIIQTTINNNRSLLQGQYIGVSFYANCSENVSLNYNYYYNYTNQPANLIIDYPRVSEIITTLIASYQLDDFYTIFSNKNTSVNRRVVFLFNNTDTMPTYINYNFLPRLRQIQFNIFTPNTTKIYNSTGDLWASDNLSLSPPNVATVYYDNVIAFQTEEIQNQTAVINYGDSELKFGLMDTETQLENLTYQKTWNISVLSILIDQLFTYNVSVVTNYSTYEKLDDFTFSATLYNSTGIYDVTSVLQIDAVSKQITIPNITINNINIVITAIDLVSPAIHYELPTPLDTSIQISAVMINVSVSDNAQIKNCTLEWDEINHTMTFSSINVTHATCELSKDNIMSNSIEVHHYKIYSFDENNNYAVSTSRQVTIDEVIPQFSDVVDNSNSVNDTETVIFNATITHSNGSIYINIDGVNYQTFGQTYNKSLSYGYHTYKWFTWSDTIANQYSESATQNIFIGTSGLNQTIYNITYNQSITSQYDYNFSYSCNDYYGQGRNATFEILNSDFNVNMSLDNLSFYGVTQVYANLPDLVRGQYYIRLICFDNVSNNTLITPFIILEHDLSALSSSKYVLYGNNNQTISWNITTLSGVLLNVNVSLFQPNGNMYDFIQIPSPYNNNVSSKKYSNPVLSSVEQGDWLAKLKIMGSEYEYNVTFKSLFNLTSFLNEQYCDDFSIGLTVSYPKYCGVNETCSIDINTTKLPDYKNATILILYQNTTYAITTATESFNIIITSDKSEDARIIVKAIYYNSTVLSCSYNSSYDVKFRRVFNISIELLRTDLLNHTNKYVNNLDYIYLIYTNTTNANDQLTNVYDNQGNNFKDTIAFYTWMNGILQTVNKKQYGGKLAHSSFLGKDVNANQVYYWDKYTDGEATITLYENGGYDIYLLNKKLSDSSYVYEEFEKPSRGDTSELDVRLISGYYLNDSTDLQIKANLLETDAQDIWNKAFVTLIIIAVIIIIHALLLLLDTIAPPVGSALSSVLVFFSVPIGLILIVITWLG